MLNSPLMLKIVLSTYYENFPDALKRDIPIDEWRQRLFNDYITTMFERRGKEMRYHPGQVKTYLSFIAGQMIKYSQTVLYIERLQPNWLQNTFKRILYNGIAKILCLLVSVLLGGLLGICIGGIAELIYGIPKSVEYGFQSGSYMGLAAACGLILTKKVNKIKTIEILHWSWVRAIQQFFKDQGSNLGSGLAAGLAAGIIFGLTIGFDFEYMLV
jgi:hypothetical protein